MAKRYVFFYAVIALTALVGCAPSGQEPSGKGATISNPETEMYKPAPLLWEGQSRDGIFWSAFTFQIIGAEVARALLPGTDDIRDFCPEYNNLRDAQRVNFWAFLVSAIAKYESGFNPQARNLEDGTDDVTGKRTYAEGLLLLSYKDIRKYAFCAFDWEKDKNLSLTDKARSILDPVKNLDCGIKILATHVDELKKIAHASNYWKVLRPNGIKSRLAEIQAAARALPFCTKP